MRYEEIIDVFADEATHIKALIGARNAKPEDEVSQDFIEVLREEGYVLPDLVDFEEVAWMANLHLNTRNQLHANDLHHEIDAYLKGYGSLGRLEKCLKTVPPGFRLKPFVAYEDEEVV